MDNQALQGYYDKWTTTAAGTSNCISSTFGGYAYVNYYPTYDKGAKAFSLVKSMRDAKLLKINTVDDFINAMTLIMREL